MQTTINYEKLGRTVSHALRHEPSAYNLHLDEHGWVSINQLVAALQIKGFPQLTAEHIITMHKNAAKARYQITNGQIRASYGHSISDKIIKERHTPPTILYHGTKVNVLPEIMKNGLQPMNRQYVHLSKNIEEANIVAARRKGISKILIINALQAHQNNICFYKEENDIWLSDAIPPIFISLINETH